MPKAVNATSGKVRGRHAKRPAVQPRVKGQRRTPRATSLLQAIDAAVQAECADFGVSKSYVLACCAAVTLGVKLPPELLYRTFRQFHLVRR